MPAARLVLNAESNRRRWMTSHPAGRCHHALAVSLLGHYFILESAELTDVLDLRLGIKPSLHLREHAATARWTTLVYSALYRGSRVRIALSRCWRMATFIALL